MIAQAPQNLTKSQNIVKKIPYLYNNQYIIRKIDAIS